MKKIWVLFSVSNDYDQPNANMEAWWEQKPTPELLAEALGITVGSNEANEVLKGGEVRLENTDYRLEQVREDVYKYKEVADEN